jgi:Mn-dependent DtxR family transcriptional regulator
VSWRRRVKRELLPLRLTFAQWLVLQTMAELIAETRDAVGELAVATRLGMDRTTVSQVTWRLARDGFVDVGPSAVWPALRNWLTGKGERMAREGAALVGAASLAWLAERRSEAA